MRKVLLAGACLFGLIGTADAATYQMQFTAHNFVDFEGNLGPPDVVGAFTYTADAPGGPVSALQSVQLSIAGHAYTLPEVGYLTVSDTIGEIGGVIGGVNQINEATIDFFLNYNSEALTPLVMIYGDGGRLSWSTRQFSGFSVTELATPLPAALPMFASGLGLLVWLKRKRRGAGRGVP